LDAVAKGATAQQGCNLRVARTRRLRVVYAATVPRHIAQVVRGLRDTFYADC